MDINGSHLPDLRSLFTDALHTVQGGVCVSDYLLRSPLDGDVYLLAIGKAACSMASGARSVLGDRIKGNLVITRHGYQTPALPGMNVVEAGHPVPDASSIMAGQQLLAFIGGIPETAKLLCLLSGGASSLVEVLPDALDLDDLQQLNQWLLKSGLAIAEINSIRKRVSRIKGGRLAGFLGKRETTVLLISDVQGDDPAVIGSGLLFAARGYPPSMHDSKLPANIQRMLSVSPPLPAPDDPCFSRIEWQIIANVQLAMQAAERVAQIQGFQTLLHRDYLHGNAIECGHLIAGTLVQQPDVLHIWGGETTVQLPQNPGRGGRCQSLALSAVITMKGQKDWCLLAAGTDGSDGVMDAAGACVDAESLSRAECQLQGNAQQYLDQADAGSFFTASGDLVVTGPTGTNVNDLVLGYRAS